MYICKTCKQREICEICHKGHEIIEIHNNFPDQRRQYNNSNSFMYHKQCHCSSNDHQYKCESVNVCEYNENIYDDLFDKKIEKQ